jgi:prevent-host-death family protein
MREVGVLEAKTNLSALLDAVDRDGEEIVITRHGKPVAKLSKAGTGAPRPRRLTGPELVEKMRQLQDKIARENPESLKVTWEELKEDMRR